jgi:hypothetical protein
VKIVTGLGCPKGGYPVCPDIYELYCKDGLHLTPNELLLWKINGSKGCVCKDGFFPRYDNEVSVIFVPFVLTAKLSPKA